MTGRRVIGIPWFQPHQWLRITEVMEDAHELPRTYLEWLRGALESIEHLHAIGRRTYQVDIDPDLFVAWCRGRGQHVAGPARQAFADEIVAQMHRAFEDEPD